jgi:glyoxylase-like metal-dependent hydrolase (beta-lactamase superfamily II)
VRGETVTHIFVTHTHIDHVPATPAVARATGAKVYSYGPHPTPAGVSTEQEGDFSFAPDIKLNDGDVVHGEGWNVEAVYTPGHISNHLCFAVKEDNALLSGDHVMGWSTAVISPPDGNMADYFASLRKLLPRPEQLFIPTHGAEIRNPHPFVEAYIEHRLGREAQIVARLKEGPQTIPQMVARNYADVPQHLHAAAGRSMLAHLIQMVKDGRVQTEDGQARIDSTYRL